MAGFGSIWTCSIDFRDQKMILRHSRADFERSGGDLSKIARFQWKKLAILITHYHWGAIWVVFAKNIGFESIKMLFGIGNVKKHI